MKCSAFNERGEPCGAEAVWDTPWCLTHNPTPEGRERHADMSSRGGRASRASQRPTAIHVDVTTPEAALATLDAIGKGLAEGRVDRGTANALSIIAKTALEAHKAASYARDIVRIKRRLNLDMDPLGPPEDDEPEDVDANGT